MATEGSVMAVIRASRPTFRNPHDKITFSLHASFLAAGYVLTAAGPPAFSEEATSDSDSSSEVGINGWNELDDCYGFVYSKEERGSKKIILVKCLVIEDKLAIDVLNCKGEKEPFHLEINVKDFVSDKENGSSGYGNIYKNFGTLVDLFNSSVLLKLEDYDSAPRSISSEKSEETEIHSTESNRPYGGVQEPYTSGFIMPPVTPGGISDLYPGPGAGFYPTGPGGGFNPTRGDMGFGGSMLVGPDDPRWRMGGQPGLMPGIPGIPPGARFDPYGPPGIPDFDPNRFVRNPRRRPGNTHPDLQPFRDPNFPDLM